MSKGPDRDRACPIDEPVDDRLAEQLERFTEELIKEKGRVRIEEFMAQPEVVAALNQATPEDQEEFPDLLAMSQEFYFHTNPTD